MDRNFWSRWKYVSRENRCNGNRISSERKAGEGRARTNRMKKQLLQSKRTDIPARKNTFFMSISVSRRHGRVSTDLFQYLLTLKKINDASNEEIVARSQMVFNIRLIASGKSHYIVIVKFQLLIVSPVKRKAIKVVRMRRGFQLPSSLPPSPGLMKTTKTTKFRMQSNCN